MHIVADLISAHTDCSSLDKAVAVCPARSVASLVFMSVPAAIKKTTATAIKKQQLLSEVLIDQRHTSRLTCYRVERLSEDAPSFPTGDLQFSVTILKIPS